jgi:carboxypeptidase D
MQIYIAGESYAGQHIPYIAKAMMDRNKKKDHDKWNVSGLLIGNGWISGKDQYASYISYAKQAGLVKPDSEASTHLDQMLLHCNRELSAGGKDHVDVQVCEAILQEILRISTKEYGSTCTTLVSRTRTRAVA